MNVPAPPRLLPCRRPVAAPRLRLLCLPYAGGGATVFHAWHDALPRDIEVRAAQFPGRQDRLREPPLTSVAAMVDGLAQALSALPPAPLVLYGHSLGALLAFELTRRLSAGDAPPRALVVAGRRAPQLPARTEPIAHLPDPEFKEAMHRIYGTPREVLQEAELMAIAMPSLRADFTAHDTYRYAEGPPIQVPLTVLHGRRDPLVLPEDAAAWSAVAAAPAPLHEVDAGHLFVDTHRAWVLARVTELLHRI